MYVEDGDDPLLDDDGRLALPDQGSNDPVWKYSGGRNFILMNISG